MISYLQRCRGFAVDDYSFTLGRLGYGASSTFAQLGLYRQFCKTQEVPAHHLKEINFGKEQAGEPAKASASPAACCGVSSPS
jgi:hypothetical protein